MRIIISPAKKMRVDTDSLPEQGLPVFLDRSRQLLERLRQLSFAQLKTLWKCSDKLAQQSLEQLQKIRLTEGLTPAILSYDGIQYQYMAPQVFSNEEFAYLQEHLRILSGFYGVLRPFDGVCPYRLEMQAKLEVAGCRDLYQFWGSSLAEYLCEGSDLILNLASREYSRCISDHLPQGVRMVTVVFGERIGGKVIEKGTLCKMARGEMVRFLAERNITDLAQVQQFDWLDYRFSAADSNEIQLVFIKQDNTECSEF